jgi:dihydropyrimidinase
MQFVSKLGIHSFKIYMNLGSDMNRILADLEPGQFDLDEIEVNMSDQLVFDIVQNVAKLSSLLLVHSEDHKMCSKFTREFNQVRDGKKRSLLELWSNSRPTSSEVVSIRKVAQMASACGTDLYFVHIGSSEALQAIVDCRVIYRNRSFWAETCPHYLTHTTEYDDLRGKVVPPLRSKNDVSMLWKALGMGLIDTIGTDHVANTLKTKIIQNDLWKSRSGFPGLATMLPVLLSEGVNKNRISLEKISEICCLNPSKIFRMFPRKGTIQNGSDADLTIIDLDKDQIVTPDLLQSYSDYTVYDGWHLRGWPVMTIVRGRLVMEDGCVDNQAIGHGKFVSSGGS